MGALVPREGIVGFACEPLTNVDLHSLLAYKVNPRLAEISSRRLGPDRPWRTLSTWVNEYDGARVGVNYYLPDDLEGYVIAKLYAWRDDLARHRIGLDEFRAYIAELALSVLERDPGLFRDLAGLLGLLGCRVRVETRILDGGQSIGGVLRLLGALREAMGGAGDTMVVLELWGRRGPVAGRRIRVRSHVPGMGASEASLVSDDNGVAVYVAPRYSLLEVDAGSKALVVVGDEEGRVRVRVGKPVGWRLLAAASAAVLALLLYLLLSP